MKTTAAVLVELGKPLELLDLDIPPLKAGQVLVDVAFSGVCHTQLLEARGRRGHDAFLPHCLGHEAGGTVRELGPGVTKCKPGDRVILSWIKGSGADVPGTVYSNQGKAVNAGGVTTFARTTVVSENRVTVIAVDFPLHQAALLGCAVPTGAGAVFHTARPGPADSLAVFGVGGVGLCAVAAAAVVGATPLVAIDVSRARLDIAARLGATHTIEAGRGDAMAELKRICPAGLDFAIEASGRPLVMVQALEAVRPQGGTVVIIGNAPHGEPLQIDPRQFNLGKRLLGTWGGDNWPDRDFPRYCRLVAAGKFDLEPLVSRTYRLEEINQALDDLETRRVTRPLIDMELQQKDAMQIGVDFDNTIVCYDALFYRLASEARLIPPGVAPTKSAVRDWLRAAGQEDAWTELQGVAYGPRIVEAEPFAGAREFFAACRQRGIGVCIISHKTRAPFRGAHSDLHAAARAWLECQGFHDPTLAGLPRDQVFFEETKQGKLQRIAEQHCTHFLDDLPEFLAEPGFPAGVARLLFDPHGSQPPLGCLRATSWADVGRLLLPPARSDNG